MFANWLLNVCELTRDVCETTRWRNDRLPIHQSIDKAYGMLQMLCEFATSQENGTDGPNDTNMNIEKLNTAR